MIFSCFSPSLLPPPPNIYVTMKLDCKVPWIDFCNDGIHSVILKSNYIIVFLLFYLYHTKKCSILFAYLQGCVWKWNWYCHHQTELLSHSSHNFLQAFLQWFCIQRQCFPVPHLVSFMYLCIYFIPRTMLWNNLWFLPENIDIKFARCCAFLSLHNAPSPAPGESWTTIHRLLQNEK
jgi:hypothetical protein